MLIPIWNGLGRIGRAYSGLVDVKNKSNEQTEKTRKMILCSIGTMRFLNGLFADLPKFPSKVIEKIIPQLESCGGVLTVFVKTFETQGKLSKSLATPGALFDHFLHGFQLLRYHTDALLILGKWGLFDLGQRTKLAVDLKNGFTLLATGLGTISHIRKIRDHRSYTVSVAPPFGLQPNGMTIFPTQPLQARAKRQDYFAGSYEFLKCFSTAISIAESFKYIDRFFPEYKATVEVVSFAMGGGMAALGWAQVINEFA